MIRRSSWIALGACVLAMGGLSYGGDISEEVQHELSNLPRLTVFDNLTDQVNGTTVTLTGEVVRTELKNDAANAAERVPGVTTVINEIEVLPQSPADNAIRQAEYRAIYSNPALRRYGNPAAPSIHIIVKHGEVTLDGVVANEGDKQTAYACANSVVGIDRVGQ